MKYDFQANCSKCLEDITSYYTNENEPRHICKMSDSNSDIQNLMRAYNESANRLFMWHQVAYSDIKFKLDLLKFYAKWSFVMLGSILGFIFSHFIIEVFK